MSESTKSESVVSETSLETLRRENTRLRGDLLTVARRISHDLRGPLGGISITSEMIKEILEEKGISAGPLVTPIFNSTNSLEKIIERVSFLLKASASPPPMTQVDMGEVFFNARQRLENQILKSGALVLEPADWPTVTGVATWLEVIWRNLLANALPQERGSSKIETGWRQDGNEFYFWVSDNGAGVPANIVHELFQPFHHLHDPNARHGLGLSIVQRLVELQSGNCGYKPGADGGSVFYFTLPCVTA
jgi:K+-sensing histidine kinase KdpD